MLQFVVTPAAAKRLIGKALVRHPAIRSALGSGMIVIVAGTTNGYVAEELLSSVGQCGGFSRRNFFRGLTQPPSAGATETGLLPGAGRFPGDVVITEGVWQKGKTIFDVVDLLKEGDVILKGANAVDMARKQAGILIAHPKGGTIGAALQAVVGRRVRLIIPVGLEKSVSSDLNDLAGRFNVPGSHGARLLPVAGEVLTEIEALALLTGAKAEAMAAGGVLGAEGAVWLAVSGSPEQEGATRALMATVVNEPPFAL